MLSGLLFWATLYVV